MRPLLENLETLCGACGPTGFEAPAVTIARGLLEPLVERAETDALGNLLGFLPCGEPGAPLLLLDAHLDEVGVMASGCEEGYVKFRPLGGLDRRVLPAQAVVFLTSPPTRGVVACLPPHVQTKEQMKKLPPAEEMYIDTFGVSVPAGTPGVFDTRGFALGQRYYCGKSLDNRAGFAAVLRALQLLRARRRTLDIAVCGSAQEEAGCRGAATAAWALRPQYALAVDVTYGKQPDTGEDGVFALGSGPAVGVGPRCCRALSERLLAVAKEKGIPHTAEVLPGATGTDSDRIALARGGVMSCPLSLPLRYMHTPAEVVCLDDIENLALLVCEWVCAGAA